MTRRKKFLLTVAGLAAFGLGFVSSVRSTPAQAGLEQRVRDEYVAEFNRKHEAPGHVERDCGSALPLHPGSTERGRSFDSGDRQNGNDRVRRDLGETACPAELEPVDATRPGG